MFTADLLGLSHKSNRAYSLYITKTLCPLSSISPFLSLLPLATTTLLNVFMSLAILDTSYKGTPGLLENPTDGGAWWAAVHGVAESWTRLNDFTFTFHFHALEKEMATHSSVLAWRIPGMGSLVGCRLWGRTESDTTEAT